MKKDFLFSDEEIKKLREKITMISEVLDGFSDEITSFGADFDSIAVFVAQKTDLSELEILEVFEFQKKLDTFVKGQKK